MDEMDELAWRKKDHDHLFGAQQRLPPSHNQAFLAVTAKLYCARISQV
jgi:hypothetical protein